MIAFLPCLLTSWKHLASRCCKQDFTQWVLSLTHQDFSYVFCSATLNGSPGLEAIASPNLAKEQYLGLCAGEKEQHF